MTQELAQHNIHYLQEQFKILYYAVDNISADKKLGDNLQFKITDLQVRNQIYAKEAEQNDRNMNMTVAERDQFRDETKELIATKKRLESEIIVSNLTSKEKIARLEIQLK